MRAILAIALIAAASPALAQERSPTERQTLVDLAYVLGESHALRQACGGAGDQFWRGRMARLIETEVPDQAFEDRLKGAFNNGYAARQTEFPGCGPETRRAEAAAAGRGQGLANRLGSITRLVQRLGPDAEKPAEPDSVAEDESPR